MISLKRLLAPVLLISVPVRQSVTGDQENLALQADGILTEVNSDVNHRRRRPCQFWPVFRVLADAAAVGWSRKTPLSAQSPGTAAVAFSGVIKRGEDDRDGDDRAWIRSSHPSCLPTMAKISLTSPRGTMPQPTSQDFFPEPAAKLAASFCRRRRRLSHQRHRHHLGISQCG